MKEKLYEKPELKIHGNVEEITKGVKPGRGETTSKAKSIA